MVMSSILRCCGVVCFVLLLGAARLQAQDATVIGTIVDESEAVLPGVTVTVTDLATGRQFFNVTGNEGEYRLVGVPAGRYTLQAELPGFAPTVIEVLELLVGQNATISLTMGIDGVGGEHHRQRRNTAYRHATVAG